jgi:Acyl-CoA dehydrogenase, C-terminal domain
MQKNNSADMDATMAKLYVSESFVKSCLDAIQIHGAGFLTGVEFEREIRDSIESTVYSGTSEVQRSIYRARAAALTSTQLLLGAAGLRFAGESYRLENGGHKEEDGGPGTLRLHI